VKIIQIAPTILALLGLNPMALEAVRIEHTPLLPGLPGQTPQQKQGPSASAYPRR
jgi:hypothetical protein